MKSDSDAFSDDDRQNSDYDGAWKEAVRGHLREFVQKCFPVLAELIDWGREPTWLDKEIGQIVGQPGRRNSEVDLLFKAWLIDGREQWILCHLEIQTYYEADFPFRIDLYNSGLKWLFRRDVLTLVILADLKADWRPSEFHFELAGFGSDRRFPVCKVLDFLESTWTADTSLVVEVARAQIAALRTANDPVGRFNAKTQLVRNLYTAGYNADEVREIFRLIDWMMHLRLDLSRQFQADLVAFEKELQMPYVTSIERHAEERGLEKGREEGVELGRDQESGLLLRRQLSRKFGTLSENVEQDIMQLSIEQRRNLSEDLLQFQSISDLIDWLKGNLQ